MGLFVSRSASGAALVAILGMLGCNDEWRLSGGGGGARHFATGGAAAIGGSNGGGFILVGSNGGGGTASTGTSSDAGPSTAESNPAVNDLCTTDPNDKVHPCGKWLEVTIPGTICGDGSQYKFFVNYSNTSNNLEVNFEPGGACWDYASCTGRGGIRGAANPHGIADDHMSNYQFLNLLNRADSNPVRDYNMVFVSYCTGDIHTGNNAIEYFPAGESHLGDAGLPGTGDAGRGDAGRVDAGNTDAGEEPVLFHHAGHANTLAVVDWLTKTFKTVPKLFVTGCSAGGAGAILNYHYVRKSLGAAVGKSYLLDDSGPIFHSDGPSKQLQEQVRSAWNVDPVLDSLAAELSISAAALKTDFGLINAAIADEFPHDRLALSAYRMDLNYSLYSYQRFFPNPSEEQIHAYWWEDLQDLMTTYDSRANLSYFLPYFRSDNCSHCVSIPPIGNAPLEPTDVGKVLTTPWLGSEIQADKIDLHQFVETLLDDSAPLKSYVEAVQASEGFTPAESNLCLAGG